MVWENGARIDQEEIVAAIRFTDCSNHSAGTAFTVGVRRALWLGVLLSICVVPVAAQRKPPAHGLWVWKGPSIVATTDGVEKLREFCRSQGVTEIYISVFANGTAVRGDFPGAIDRLHRSGIRVEALLSSTNADEPGDAREKLLAQAREVVRFNENHPHHRFDGIHLDIEPQQRKENHGPGNLRFLQGLVDIYGAVRSIAETAQVSVTADIPTKVLKADSAQRKLLMTSLPRLTLMLYEISSPNDGDSVEEKKKKLQAKTEEFLNMAYDGLQDSHLATMQIGLRSPDYGQLMPEMLASLDTANRENPHYAGWAEHSYNNTLPTH
jgi:hypothetical protein